MTHQDLCKRWAKIEIDLAELYKLTAEGIYNENATEKHACFILHSTCAKVINFIDSISYEV